MILFLKSLPARAGSIGLTLSLIYFFSCLPVHIEASEDKIDSLRQEVLKDYPDENLAMTMDAMAREFVKSGRNDSARYYAEKALSIAERTDNIEILASSYLIICRDQWIWGYLPEALETSRKMIYYSEQLRDPDMLARAFYHQGVVYGMMGETDSAIYLFRSSLSHVKTDSVTLMASYLGLGNNFGQTGEYDSSLHYKLMAARIAELTGKEYNLVTIFYSIGITFEETGDAKGCEKYFRSGLEIAQKLQYSDGIADGYNKLAGVHFNRDALDSSLYYLDEARKLFKANGDTTGWSELYDYYGLIYFRQKRYPEALSAFDSAIKVTRISNTWPELMSNYRNKSSVYNELKDYPNAWRYLDSARMIAAEFGFRDDHQQILRAMGMVSYLSKDYKRSVEELDSAMNIKDSLFSEEKVKAVLEINQKYEKERDQARILSLEKESLKRKLQRNLILFNGSALIAAALFFLMMLRHKLVKTKLISKQKISRLEEEKKLLQARNLVDGQEEERKRIAMELHDGLGVILSATKMQFSTLDNAASMEPKLMEKAIRLLEQASGEVRRISHNLMPGLLTKLGLYEAIDDLFESINETKLLGASVSFEGDRDRRLPENTEIMLYRIIQELVNNTMKYAKASQIRLSLSTAHSPITINYSDNGTGFDPDEVMNSGKKSIGLKSIESRVGFLNGQMTLKSAPGKGVDYLFTIPVNFEN